MKTVTGMDSKSHCRHLLVSPAITVKEAMRQMDKAGEKTLFVTDERDVLLGSLSDGDIRRWVLADGNLSSTVGHIFHKDPIKVRVSYKKDTVKDLMLTNKIESIPVVDEEDVIMDVLLWDVVLGEERPVLRQMDVPVVVMAGGKGTRLDPLTRILPKPLIPIGDRSIIEVILGKFHGYGISEFYISTHHKSRMIKAYFEEINLPYHIHYVEESEPLGTAGSLKLLADKIEGDFFVSNCDVLIETDYYDILDFHRRHENDLTIVGSWRHLIVPYGICKIEDGGKLIDLEEKPEFDFLANTGMYVVNSDVLKLIPEGVAYNITHLIDSVRARGGRVRVYPIHEKAWHDIGQWDEYLKSVKAIGEMKV